MKNILGSGRSLFLSMGLAAVAAAALGGCTQQQVSMTVSGLQVACADVNTGEAVAAVVDPSLLASANAAAAEAIVTKACAAINAIPAPGAVAAAVATAPLAAAVNAAALPVAATPATPTQ